MSFSETPLRTPGHFSNHQIQFFLIPSHPLQKIHIEFRFSQCIPNFETHFDERSRERHKAKAFQINFQLSKREILVAIWRSLNIKSRCSFSVLNMRAGCRENR